MSKLPQVSGSRLIRALERSDFYVKRQTGGHAIVVHKKDLNRRAIIPVHGNKSIKLGTLRTILEGLQLSIEEIRTVL